MCAISGANSRPLLSSKATPMHSSIRNFALPLSIFAVSALGACKSDATDYGTKDVLAQDSSLDLAVMSATGDSVGTASGDTNFGSAAPATPQPSISAPAPSARVATTPARVSTSTVSTQTRRNRSSRLVSASRTSPSRASTIRTPARIRRRARVLRPTTQSASSTVIASAPIVTSSAAAPTRDRTSRATSAVIPTGASFSLVSQQKICASSAKAGDTFSASLAKDVVSPSGVVIPAGTSATGEVISKANKDSRMRVALKSIDFDGHSYPVSSDVTFTDMESVKIQPKGGSTSRVLAGAGIGAILGRVMGGNAKSTIIGAAGGAAAGAVVANQSVRYDQCLPDGGQIIAHLAQPLRVQLGD
jgi:hypothetical protein